MTYWQNRLTISIKIRVEKMQFLYLDKKQYKETVLQHNGVQEIRTTHIARREEHLPEGLGYGGHQTCCGDALGGLGILWSRSLVLCQQIIRLERNWAEHHPLKHPQYVCVNENTPQAN